MHATILIKMKKKTAPINHDKAADTNFPLVHANYPVLHMLFTFVVNSGKNSKELHERFVDIVVFKVVVAPDITVVNAPMAEIS